MSETAERVFHEYEQNNATVEIVGHRVTVSFDVPFRRGEKFIHPHTLGEEHVSLAPAVTIRLGANDGPELKLSELHVSGHWYTDHHRQMSGAREFTPSRDAVLDYWCGQPWEWLEPHLPRLRKFFDSDQQAQSKLQAAAESALSREIDLRKVEMSSKIIMATKRISGFEEKLEMVREGLL